MIPGWRRYRRYDGRIFEAYRTTRPRPIPTPGGIKTAWPGWYVLFDLEKGEFGIELPCLFEEWYGATSGPDEWHGRGL